MKKLHAQKVEILSRLIKNSDLTLDEALVLLRDESTEGEDVVKPLEKHPLANLKLPISIPLNGGTGNSASIGYVHTTTTTQAAPLLINSSVTNTGINNN